MPGSELICIFAILGENVDILSVIPDFEESKAVWSDVETLVQYTEEIPTHQSNENDN